MEANMTTKERIVHESLKLFSKKGYDGVSMREIAAAVGIKGASLYNHFSGKEEIFSAIFTEMTRRYDEAASALHVPEGDGAGTVSAYAMADEAALMAMGEAIFAFFARDEFAVMFRKLLISEQYKSELAAKCFKQYYIDAPYDFQRLIFAGLQENGMFQKAQCDADTLALHFYSPLFYLLLKYDAGAEYGACVEQLKKHVRLFCGNLK